jgi:hypothetical protein
VASASISRKSRSVYWRSVSCVDTLLAFQMTGEVGECVVRGAVLR